MFRIFVKTAESQALYDLIRHGLYWEGLKSDERTLLQTVWLNSSAFYEKVVEKERDVKLTAICEGLGIKFEKR